MFYSTCLRPNLKDPFTLPLPLYLTRLALGPLTLIENSFALMDEMVGIF
jgi:hypothetical protein